MLWSPDYLIEEDKIIEIATSPLKNRIIHEQIDPNAMKIRLSITLLLELNYIHSMLSKINGIL